MLSPPAVAAEIAAPYRVELLGEWIDEGGIVGEYAVLKVQLSLGLCAHTCAGKVRAAEICLDPIHDDALEMNARA